MDLDQVLIEAAKDGNMLVLKTALEKGADINAKDGSGMTALMYAIKRGDWEIVNFLKEKGAKREGYWKAITDCTEAIELDPQDADAYNNRGSAYYNLGEHQKAIDDFYQAGILYLQENNRDDAIVCINSMKKIDPSSQLIHRLQDSIDQK